MVPCRAVLALTATATRATQRSIQEVLHIPEGNVVRDSVLPANLRLRVQLVPPGPAGPPAEFCNGPSQSTQNIWHRFSHIPKRGTRIH